MSETNNYIVKMKTNEVYKSLIFENWKYQQGSAEGYMFDVSVQSGDFIGKQPFFLYRASFKQFLNKLEKMAARLYGSTELKEEYENHYVKMELDTTGHVTVVGEFWYYSHLEQHLKFGFVTDQTCLIPLHNDLSRVVNELHTKK